MNPLIYSAMGLWFYYRGTVAKAPVLFHQAIYRSRLNRNSINSQGANSKSELWDRTILYRGRTLCAGKLPFSSGKLSPNSRKLTFCSGKSNECSGKGPKVERDISTGDLDYTGIAPPSSILWPYYKLATTKQKVELEIA